jgi:signal transduction histidine kinase/ActR/RegA family two-component response regulator
VGHLAAHRVANELERLTWLAQGAGRLLSSLSAELVVNDVLALAREAVTADGYAVWRRRGGVWAVAASAGLDPEFTTATLPADDEPHHPDDIELQVAAALGHLAATAISSAELHAEQQALRQQAIRASERARFLAEVSARLNSLDDETNLNALAQLSVPTLADWCMVDLIEASGELTRLTIAHVDPAKVALAQQAHRRYPTRTDADTGVGRVLRTGRPELYEEISDALLVAHARDAEQLQMLRGLGLRSAMLVPLAMGSELFGVLTFATATSGRRYDEQDLAFAMDLARRASFAIENAKLYRRAQDASPLKDEFLAALSHELRTPLNAILGWAHLLRIAPPDQLQLGVEVIERNARAQARLVDDLLDASRIASGKMTLDLSDTDLGQALDAAIARVAPEAAVKNIHVEVAMPRRQCIVRGDPPRLQQVLINLLSNAIKFTPNGGTIKVELAATSRSTAVRVTDCGAGIPRDFLPFVLDRFRQAEASTTRFHRGLGLGLTLARQLTEMQGGRILATSDGIGKGSTFSVEFPLVEPTVTTRSGPCPEHDIDMFKGRHVLVVDDDPDSLEFLSRFLREQRADVTTASSAIDGLLIFRRVRPDLLISDLAMPDWDGYWLIEQVRQLTPSEGGTASAIAVSAFATAAARERALAAGFTAHLRKPLNTDELRTLLYVTCGWRGPATEPRRVELI